MTRSTPSPKGKPDGKPAWLIGMFLLIPAALAGALYLDSLPGTPYIPPSPHRVKSAAPAISPARIRTLESRVDLLEQQYAALLASPPPVAARTPSDAPSPETAQPAAPSVSQEEIASLKEELAAVKAQLEEGSPWKNAHLVALYRLEKAANTGAPFEEALDILLEDPGLPERVSMKLHGIVKAAQQGIATEPTLGQMFDETMEAYTSGAVMQEDPKGSAWDQVKHNLSSLVTIRKVGDVSGDSDRARLARAQEALGDGDITAAIGEISQLSHEAAPYFEEWLTRARLRIKTLETIDRARTLLEDEGKPSSPASGPGNV